MKKLKVRSNTYVLLIVMTIILIVMSNPVFAEEIEIIKPTDGSSLSTDYDYDFEWTGNANSYKVELIRNEDNSYLFNSEITENYTWFPGSQFKPGSYTFRVTSLNSTGEKISSDVVHFNFGTDEQVRVKLINLTEDQTIDPSFTFRWESEGSVEYFDIDIKNTDTGDYVYDDYETDRNHLRVNLDPGYYKIKVKAHGNHDTDYHKMYFNVRGIDTSVKITDIERNPSVGDEVYVKWESKADDFYFELKDEETNEVVISGYPSNNKAKVIISDNVGGKECSFTVWSLINGSKKHSDKKYFDVNPVDNTIRITSIDKNPDPGSEMIVKWESQAKSFYIELFNQTDNDIVTSGQVLTNDTKIIIPESSEDKDYLFTVWIKENGTKKKYDTALLKTNGSKPVIYMVNTSNCKPYYSSSEDIRVSWKSNSEAFRVIVSEENSGLVLKDEYTTNQYFQFDLSKIKKSTLVNIRVISDEDSNSEISVNSFVKASSFEKDYIEIDNLGQFELGDIIKASWDTNSESCSVKLYNDNSLVLNTVVKGNSIKLNDYLDFTEGFYKLIVTSVNDDTVSTYENFSIKDMTNNIKSSLTPNKEVENSTLEMWIGRNEFYFNGIKGLIDSNHDITPIVVNGSTLVPVRAVIEALGGEVTWNGNKNEVLINCGNDTISIVLDSLFVSKNGIKYSVQQPAINQNGRVRVPVRIISELMGYNVDWVASERKITIYSKNDTTNANGQKVEESFTGLNEERYNQLVNNFKRLCDPSNSIGNIKLIDYAASPQSYSYYWMYQAITNGNDNSWRSLVLKLNDGIYNDGFVKMMSTLGLENLSHERAESILVSLIEYEGKEVFNKSLLDSYYYVASLYSYGFTQYLVEYESKGFDKLFDRDLGKLGVFRDQVLKSMLTYIESNGEIPPIQILSDSLKGKVPKESYAEVDRIIKQFVKSKYIIENAEKYFDNIGKVVDISKVIATGSDQYFNMMSVAKANTEFIDLVILLENNANLKDVRDIAHKLRTSYESELIRKLNVVNATISEGSEVLIDNAISDFLGWQFVVAKVSMNVAFRPGSISEYYDQIRIITCVNTAISNEVNKNIKEFNSTDDVMKKSSALNSAYNLSGLFLKLSKKGEESVLNLVTDKYSTSNAINKLFTNEELLVVKSAKMRYHSISQTIELVQKFLKSNIDS